MTHMISRAKNKDTGWWVEGYYACESNHACFGNELKYSHFIFKDEFLDWGIGGLVKYEVVPETVGRCTGIADKNYKMIFEGDILKVGISQRLMYVRWNGESLAWELTDVGVTECEVNHLINTFDLAEIQIEAAYGEMLTEIVGNIHDNPELMKGDEPDV